MDEKKNVFSKISTFLKKHPWGCVGWTIFVLLMFSFIFLFAFDGTELAINLQNRRFWTIELGYIVTSLISITMISSSVNRLSVEENLFFSICWLALVLMETWCWFFDVTFLLPVCIIFVVCLCYLFGHKSTPKFIIWKKILWLFISTGIAFGVSLGEYSLYKKLQYALQKALQSPPIELIDIKDEYIFTKEFGLEKVCVQTQMDSLKKGDMIYRFKTDNCVYIIKKH